MATYLTLGVVGLCILGVLALVFAPGLALLAVVGGAIAIALLAVWGVARVGGAGQPTEPTERAARERRKHRA